MTTLQNPSAMTPELKARYDALRRNLSQHSKLAVAFSGGVDSTLLLSVAHDILGDNAVAFTASSCTFPQRELDEATAFCQEHGIKQVVFPSEELEVEGFSQNPPNRCYLCKQALFSAMAFRANSQGITDIADGTNLDDLHDYRPGRQAKDEQGVHSPLADTGFDKQAIRALSKELGLKTFDKQSFACLASRIPYGDLIDEAILHRIDLAEQYLLDSGFNQVRVRVHGDIARIEMPPAQFPLLFREGETESAVERLKEIGFRFVTLDLEGYRSGSMNDTLGNPQGTPRERSENHGS